MPPATTYFADEVALAIAKAEIALDIAKRPAGLGDRWAVGIDRRRVICVPYADRDRMRPVLICVKVHDANNGPSPATWQRIRNQIQNVLAN